VTAYILVGSTIVVASVALVTSAEVTKKVSDQKLEPAEVRVPS
jgi:hypothetical protein